MFIAGVLSAVECFGSVGGVGDVMEATALGKKLFSSLFVQNLMTLYLFSDSRGQTDCGHDGLSPC